MTQQEAPGRGLRPQDLRSALIVCLVLTLLTLGAYHAVGGHAFIRFDDYAYVVDNPHVRQGLSPQGLSWAFRAFYHSYWHPVTWLSHMADVSLFGLDAAGHHLTNLLFHCANACMLFWVFWRMSAAFWPSALMAALFALHPMNVESVAWVAERKNVLSTFFWMLTLLAYERYVRRPGTWRYAWVLCAFTIGMLSKPMLVTLPCVLLLLDFWPLGRLGPAISQPRSLGRLLPFVWEKIPLMTIGILVVWVAGRSARIAGHAVSFDAVSLGLRCANAVVSYVKYMGGMLWPARLAVYYPYPDGIAPWQILGASALLVLMSLLMLRASGRRPYLAVGWLWFVGSLVPAIGLVQNGLWPAMADRFAYVPMIGLFAASSWGLADLVGRLTRWRRTVSGVAAGVLLALLFGATHMQVAYWRDSRTLFAHAVRVTPDNSRAYFSLGHALAVEGKLSDAMDSYRRALEIEPAFPEAHNNLAHALFVKGRTAEAERHYRQALAIDPEYTEAYNNLAHLRFTRGDPNDARELLQRALQIDPQYGSAHSNLANVYAAMGQKAAAAEHYRRAIDTAPERAEFHFAYGRFLIQQERHAEAGRQLAEAIRLRPDYADAYYHIGWMLARQGHFDRAAEFVAKSLQLDPTCRERRRSLEGLRQMASSAGRLHSPADAASP